MTEADAEDIRRVLAICFRGESELDAMDIERILSLIWDGSSRMKLQHLSKHSSLQDG